MELPKILPEFTGDKVSKQGELNTADLQALGKNILKFSAPALAVFFAQLTLGVDLKAASLVALYVLYGLLSDYFKKLNDGKK